MVQKINIMESRVSLAVRPPFATLVNFPKPFEMAWLERTVEGAVKVDSELRID
jgi:hypothetical protein